VEVRWHTTGRRDKSGQEPVSIARYGIMYGVKRTTIYLPDDLKAKLEAAAHAEGRTEADVIREALAAALETRPARKPRLPLTEATGQTTNWAERVDELLGEGFGRS